MLPSAATCSLPLCKSCLSGKGRQHGLNSAEGTVNEDHDNVIKDGDLLPGDCVYTDQYECRVKGRLPGSNGKEDPTKMFSGGMFFLLNSPHQQSSYTTKCH